MYESLDPKSNKLISSKVYQETAMFQSLIEGKPISQVSTGVDFVDCTMDPQVFRDRYVMNGGRPVIIRGVPKHQAWPSHVCPLQSRPCPCNILIITGRMV